MLALMACALAGASSTPATPATPTAATAPTTPTEAARQEAVREGNDYVAGSGSEQDKIQFALSTFYGYYFVNTRSRVSYCSTLGVDIAPFAQAFAQANQDTRELAVRLLPRYGLTEEKFFEVLRPEMAEFNRKNMEEVAAQDKVTATKECEGALMFIPQQVERLIFAKAFPAVVKVLRDAQ